MINLINSLICRICFIYWDSLSEYSRNMSVYIQFWPQTIIILLIWPTIQPICVMTAASEAKRIIAANVASGWEAPKFLLVSATTVGLEAKKITAADAENGWAVPRFPPISATTAALEAKRTIAAGATNGLPDSWNLSSSSSFNISITLKWGNNWPRKALVGKRGSSRRSLEVFSHDEGGLVESAPRP